MNKISKTIYRVDDRFIHGQVIEGWINYFRIPNIILVNDSIVADEFKKIIYESIIPAWSSISIMSVDDFKLYNTRGLKGDTLIILGSVYDLGEIISKILPEDYINIGCLACGVRYIEVTDTVFIGDEECKILRKISSAHDVFVHKLPWETPLNIKDIIDNTRGKS